MRKLSYQISAAKLPSIIHLQAKEANEPCWSSKFHKLQPFIYIEKCIPDRGIPEREELHLNDTELDESESLCKKFAKLYIVTVVLQTQSLALSDAKTLFDTVIEKHASTNTRLSQRGAIVENPNFELAIVKVQTPEANTFSTPKKSNIGSLQANIQYSKRRNDEGRAVFFQLVSKRRRLENVLQCNTQYIDIWFELKSLNLYDHLFCLARFAFRARCMAVFPGNLETQMFLYVNSTFWSVSDGHLLTKKIDE